MPEKEPAMKWPWQIFDPAELAKVGQIRADISNEAQRELSGILQEAGEYWRSRAELERDLAAELAIKLITVKSLPDAAKIYQEWMSRRMDLMARDSQKLLTDSQKYMNALGRLWQGGIQDFNR